MTCLILSTGSVRLSVSLQVIVVSISQVDLHTRENQGQKTDDSAGERNEVRRMVIAITQGLCLSHLNNRLGESLASMVGVWKFITKYSVQSASNLKVSPPPATCLHNVRGCSAWWRLRFPSSPLSCLACGL